MGTVTGARAIGLDREIGSIEPGKRADIIAVRTDTPRMTPIFAEEPYFNLHHNLVHAVRGGDVSLTMVDGRIVVEDGELKTADLAEIIAEIHKLAPGHFARRAAFLAENAKGMVQWTTGL
jgi:5-methylthioadenosine/S-adenosylhomocysteine deaminase